jgi:radical SAM-linked protein
VKVQRLRVRYELKASAASLSHRELINVWVDATQGAGLPLAYSQGKRPTPQIANAAPLPTGVTSSCELVDVFLSERVDPAVVLMRLAPKLPEGLKATRAWEIGLPMASLQSQLRWAEYEVDVAAGVMEPDEVRRAIDQLLEAGALPWEHRRENKVKRYDLRSLVLNLLLSENGGDDLHLVMRLRAQPETTGRADQVLAALGLPEARRIHRTRLEVEEVQPVVLAYRRLGQRRER